MSKVTILHLADAHLERKISHLNTEKSKIRRSEALLTLKRAIEHFSDAQIVLLSGDLFDGECTDGTVDFLVSLFNKNTDKCFFISCGNHDCCESPAMKNLIAKAPQNVKIFGETTESIFIDEMGVCVHGVSFSAQNSYTSLLRGFKTAQEDMINIMCMHGEVSADSKYNPISQDEIASSGLDYLALGHVHTFSGFMTAGKTTYAYPGVLEPCGFDETGNCGVIYGEISKDNVCLDFYPISRRKYHCIDLDISDFTSDEQIISAIIDRVKQDDIYKINLCGQKQDFVPNIQGYKEIIDVFWLEICDLSKDSDSILNYCNELSLRGKTAEHLKKLQNEYDTDTYNKACEIITNLMCRG